VLNLLSEFFHKPYAAPDVDMTVLMNAIQRIPDVHILQNIQLAPGMLLSEQTQSQSNAQENGVSQRDTVLGKRIKSENGNEADGATTTTANGKEADGVQSTSKSSSVTNVDPHHPPPIDEDLFAQYERPKKMAKT
jgi:hypothetical protein